MLHPQSPLLNLPKNIHPRQVVVLDGIRHAVEMASFAYHRLCKRLSSLALREDGSENYMDAFIDAWAIVDNIDRFRQILSQDKNFVMKPQPGAPSINELFQPIRNVRNVADHLAQRVDYVVANKGTALGSIGWFTCLDGKTAQLCVLGPGSANDGRAFPATKPKSFSPPTDAVILRAGEYTCDLSEAYRTMLYLLSGFEQLLIGAFKPYSAQPRHVLRDVVIIVEMEFTGELMAPADNPPPVDAP